MSQHLLIKFYLLAVLYFIQFQLLVPRNFFDCLGYQLNLEIFSYSNNIELLILFYFLLSTVTGLFRKGLVIHGCFQGILEQSGWSENNSLLGTCCQLGICSCWVGGHEETPGDDFGQHDSSNVCLLGIVHEICVDGTAPQLSTSGMPCLE